MAKQELKPIEIEDLLTYKFPENLLYSPDGKYLAFQVSQARSKENDYERNIWISENGKAKQVTYQ